MDALESHICFWYIRSAASRRKGGTIWVENTSLWITVRPLSKCSTATTVWLKSHQPWIRVCLRSAERSRRIFPFDVPVAAASVITTAPSGLPVPGLTSASPATRNGSRSFAADAAGATSTVRTMSPLSAPGS